ncbi:S-adenosyl-L-methionine-dependent methyltransferase [Lophiostoma macrostomum CBS 122681]|uniref:S-adenosyl-L-methionine-dependent methyltransferase n=1 Tax=Lophiostoma macrostomum CBS 122681 TaxID=1314788 RepID=A0A6A6TLZ7_9PLEO|nr:S-adenosyl-L-methionine-dependent methyltransferase [Lophiostoma macrostomum CBS 122681]
MAVSTRIEALVEEIQSLSRDVDDTSRKDLLAALQQGVAKVEPPVETIWKYIMSPHSHTAIMVLLRMGVVQDVVAAGKPKTSKEIASSCSVDEELLVRMMRVCVAIGFFAETDVRTYDSTPLSQTLVAPPLSGGYQYMFELVTRSLANLPRYLERTGFKDVEDAPGPFQDAHQTNDGLFGQLVKNPELMGFFNAFMSGVLATRSHWFKVFPADEILIKDADQNDPDAVLLVDVAGGKGHDIAAFQQAYPTAPGKLVLQDLPPVIGDIESLDVAIVRQEHDMFTSQPIKGARAYYFRNIFHDWPDKECVQFCKQIAAAMKPGYSKVLIFEWVLPDRAVPMYPALLDINMMAALNGRERTEAQWTRILTEAGLKINKVWINGPESEGLIEAELAT